MENGQELIEAEVIAPDYSGQAVALTRTEIDMQVSTAHAYPRSNKEVISAMMDLVTVDAESAQECIYALPIDDKPITGPSVRFAEALAASYGNCQQGARITEVNRTDQYVEAEGVFWDLQANMRRVHRTRRSIRGKNGRTYNERMIVTTGNAACAIALREAVLKGVPKPLWRAAWEAVLKTIKGDIKTLSERRKRAVEAFAIFGVSADKVYAKLGVNGIEDIGLDHLPNLFAMFQSIRNGEATVEDFFSEKTAEAMAMEVKNPLDDGPSPEKKTAPSEASLKKAKPKSPGDDSSAPGDGQRSGHAAGSHPAAGPASPSPAPIAAEAAQIEPLPTRENVAADPEEPAERDWSEDNGIIDNEDPPLEAAVAEVVKSQPSVAMEMSTPQHTADEARESGYAARAIGTPKRNKPGWVCQSPELIKAYDDGFDRRKLEEK